MSKKNKDTNLTNTFASRQKSHRVTENGKCASEVAFRPYLFGRISQRLLSLERIHLRSSLRQFLSSFVNLYSSRVECVGVLRRATTFLVARGEASSFPLATQAIVYLCKAFTHDRHTTETWRPRIQPNAWQLILAPESNDLGHVALFVKPKKWTYVIAFFSQCWLRCLRIRVIRVYI